MHFVVYYSLKQNLRLFFLNIKSLLYIWACKLMCEKVCKIFIINSITGNEACL
jgi:hypothetical protein